MVHSVLGLPLTNDVTRAGKMSLNKHIYKISSSLKYLQNDVTLEHKTLSVLSVNFSKLRFIHNLKAE